MKKVLIAIVVLIIVMIIGLLSFILLVNPNNYKSIIEKQVAAQTGYTLNLSGDLSWHIWPQISLSTQQVTLSSAAQTKPILSAAAMRLDVELIPLFSHQIIIKQAVIDGATVNIGPNSFPSKSQPAANSSTASLIAANDSNSSNVVAANQSTSKESHPWKLAIHKVSIVNSSLNIEQASQQQLNLTQINLAVGQTSPEKYAVNFSGNLQLPQQSLIHYRLQGALDLTQLQATQLKFNGAVQQNSNQLDYQLTAQADLSHYPNAVVLNLAPFSYQMSSSSLPNLTGSIQGRLLYQAKPVMTLTANNLQLMLNKDAIQSNLNVTLGNKPNIQLQLTANTLDLTPFLTADTTKSTQQPATQQTTSIPSGSKNNTVVATTKQANTSPNSLSFLTQFDAKVKASIQTLIVNKNLSLKQVMLNGSNNNGAAQLNLTMQALDGQVKLDATANGNTGQGWIKATPQLLNIQLAALGDAFANFPSVTGTMNASGELLLTQFTPAELLSSLNGNLKVQTNDLKLNNTNLLQIIQSKLPSAMTQNSKSVEPTTQKYTDLGQLTLATQIQSGVFKLTQAEARSPLFNLAATGWINPIQQNLDVALNINLLKNSRWNNSFWQQLEGKTLPLKMTGSFSQPSYQLDVSQLLQNEVKQQISKQLDKLKTGDKEGGVLNNPNTQKLLNSIFN